MFVDRVQVMTRLCDESKFDNYCSDVMVILFLVSVHACCKSVTASMISRVKLTMVMVCAMHTDRCHSTCDATCTLCETEFVVCWVPVVPKTLNILITTTERLSDIECCSWLKPSFSVPQVQPYVFVNPTEHPILWPVFESPVDEQRFTVCIDHCGQPFFNVTSM